MANIDRALVLSVNRALWGEVGPSLRRVYVTSRDGLVLLRFYFDGPISEEDRESASCASTEVIADFSDHRISEELIRCDAPAPIPVDDGWHCVYARRET
jgi:hypothetical protein